MTVDLGKAVLWQSRRLTGSAALLHRGNGHQHTLAEVGEQLQMSRERVRRIEHEALQKLRRLDGERLFACHQEL